MSPDTTSPLRLILGLMTFGPNAAQGGRITSLDAFNACLDQFQHRGYNEVNTARLYVGGKQEAFTAETHWKERGLKKATKWYPIMPGAFKADMIKTKLEESLTELKTDSVDIFYLHAADRTVPFEETLEAVDQLYKAGKFKQLGLSNFSSFEVAEVVTTCNLRGWVRPTIYQGVYNAITRSIETELIPCCRRYGINIVIFNPLAGGILAGKYKSKVPPKDGRYSDATGPMAAMYRDRYFKDSTFEALRVIEKAVSKHNLTMAETALRWCVHHSKLKVVDGGKDGIIIGASSIGQLENNITNLEKGPLPKDVAQALVEAWLIAKPTRADIWHGELKYTYNTQEALFGSLTA